MENAVELVKKRVKIEKGVVKRLSLRAGVLSDKLLEFLSGVVIPLSNES